MNKERYKRYPEKRQQTCACYLPVNPRAFELLTVGTLTQNESNKARPVGHFTFVLKRLSAVGNKWFRDSLIQQMRRFHGSFHMGFSVVEQLLSLRYIVISWNMPGK